MDNIKNRPLCMAPFYGISIKADENTGLRLKQCCESSLVYPDPSFGGSNTDPKSFFESDLMNEIRESLANNKFHKSCVNCKYMDKLGINTTQEKYERTYDQILKLGDNKATHDLNFLDIRLSNKCNLKCRMCSPSNSSAISKELYPDKNSLVKIENHQEVLSTIDFSKVLFLKISGGEPFIMDETVDVLENNLNPHLTLIILTNAYYLKESVLDKISKLKIKRIHFQVSIDGTQKFFEYIRVGTNWKSVTENLKRLKNINSLTEVTIGVTHVPQLWNAFDIPDFIKWVIQNDEIMSNENTYYPKMFFSNVVQPYLSLTNLYDEDKKMLNDSLESLIDQVSLSDKKIFIDPILKIINGDTCGGLQQFRDETDSYDKRYSTSLQKLDSRYEKYLS
jgi:pyruvate-formate lyase-activating enzyme